VGINTASPGSTFKLDVNGAANIASIMVVQGMTIGVGNAAAQTSNTVVGNAALSSNTTGAYNATFGYESLKANTTGANNVAMGYRALTANTSGGTNVAIGVGALEQTTTGSSNTALGGSAGAYLNTSNNTLIGFRAGSACCTLNTTNTDNIYIGFETGMNTIGSYNTFIGNSVNNLGTISNNIILADGQGNIRYRWNGTTNNFTGSVTASSFIKSGGTSSQYLMADGSISTGGGVTSISGGSTGLTPATATSGAVTLAGTLAIANGGTGATTASGALTNLGAAALASPTFTGSVTIPTLSVTSKAGVGITPTANLHIKAGTASANTAPLKLTAGTNLTTAEAGAIEFDGTNLYFTNASNVRQTIATIATSALQEVIDEYSSATGVTGVLTAGQTSFTLSQTPNSKSKVKMLINGIFISSTAYSLSGSTITYNSANNGAKSMATTDRVQFFYSY
jgi:hypothetical protein